MTFHLNDKTKIIFPLMHTFTIMYITVLIAIIAVYIMHWPRKTFRNMGAAKGSEGGWEATGTIDPSTKCHFMGGAKRVGLLTGGLLPLCPPLATSLTS